jgi:hypothetical protein
MLLARENSSSKCGVRSAECGVRSEDAAQRRNPPSAACQTRSVECGVKSEDNAPRSETAKCRMRSVESWARIGFAGGVDRGNGDGGEFTRLLNKGVCVEWFELASVNKHLQPKPRLISFFLNCSHLRNEICRGLGSAGRPIVGPNRSATSNQLTAKHLARLVLRQVLNEHDHIQPKLLRPALQILVIHSLLFPSGHILPTKPATVHSALRTPHSALPHPHTSALRNCLSSNSSSGVFELAVKKLMPRPRQNSRSRWRKACTVC